MFNDITVQLISGELDIEKPARVQISMFNPFCTGKHLTALSDWINQQGFPAIEYQLSDTLQRHNFMWRDQLSPGRARARAIHSGEQWLSQNFPVIQLCFQNFEKVSISRWDFWIQHKEFPEMRTFFKELSVSNAGFRDALDEEIESYFNKSKRSLNEERKKLSLEFLIEEIAVSEISAKFYPANEIYPGPRFLPEQYLVENEIESRDLYMKKMPFVHVDIIDRNVD